MMVAETSALMAIALQEPEEEEFSRIMHDDGQVLVSAATLVELYIVALGRGEDVCERAQSLHHELPITVFAQGISFGPIFVQLRPKTGHAGWLSWGLRTGCWPGPWYLDGKPSPLFPALRHRTW